MSRTQKEISDEWESACVNAMNTVDAKDFELVTQLAFLGTNLIYESAIVSGETVVKQVSEALTKSIQAQLNTADACEICGSPNSKNCADTHPLI